MQYLSQRVHSRTADSYKVNVLFTSEKIFQSKDSFQSNNTIIL